MDKWCSHFGTEEQYTRCEKVIDNGETCINPTIRSGDIKGGVPSRDYMHTNQNITEWCQLLFGVATYGYATWGTRNCKGGEYPVIWLKNQGKFEKWGPDPYNRNCLRMKLMQSVTCKEEVSGIFNRYFRCC